MKFSIIVPTYGVEKYIAGCIASLKAQTFKDFECLIVNDETKDNSVQVAIEAIGNDSRFAIYHKKNGGLSDARNYGMRFAKGEYVFFLDSDDTVTPNTLESIAEKIDKYNSDIVLFDIMYVYEDGREELSVGGYTEVTSYKEDSNIIYVNNSACNKVYRRTFLEDKRFIKGMWYEDLAVIPVWLSEANNVSYVNKPLYRYLQREGSIMHQADNRLFDIYKACKEIQDGLNKTADEIYEFYYGNCVVMTTLRIREISDDTRRIEFYKKNVKYLNECCPNWYSLAMKKNPNFKQKIVFTLMKMNMISLLDRVYRK